MSPRIKSFIITTLYILTFCTTKNNTLFAQKGYQEYIEQYKHIAIAEARRTGIPASITLAQAIHESNVGKSRLAKDGNNHFGIKCHNEWTGDVMYEDDDTLQECFRVYTDVAASYKDHSDFLKNKKRYEILFQLPSTDYVAWAYILKECGYATNPQYPQLLVKIIEENKLYELDRDTPTESPATATTHATSNTPTQPKKKYKTSRKNGMDVIILNQDLSTSDLATELDLSEKKIIEYNDLNYQNKTLPSGTILYLEKKKSSTTQKFHVVKEGENTWLISQKYGIHMSIIYKYNRYFYPSEPKVGETIYLDEKRDAPILLQ